MSCRTDCRNFSLVLALLALAIVPVPVFAQANNCMADVSSANSCTAGDVSIAAVKQGTVNVFQGGIPGTNQCIAGGQFSFTADFEVKTTSSSTRSNIGIFFGTGQASALHGTCTNAILAPAHSCAGGTATCGDAQYSEKDTDKNGEPGVEPTQASCGDTASGDSSTDFGAGTHAAVLEVDGATCPSTGTSACPAGSGFTGTCLALNTCSSWYQPAKNMPVCESPAPSYPWVPAAIPGAPSKCTCGIVYVPVTPITVAPIVQKACTTATSTPQTPVFTQNPNTASPTTCDAGVEGSTATYTVAITNTSTTTGNNIVVDQVCDNKYGTIYSAFSQSTCPAGATGLDGTATNVSCPPSPIAAGSTGQCTFTAPVGENASVTDTVSASGHSSLSSTSTFTNTQSNTVTVTSTDAPSTAKTTKGVEGTLPPVSACVTARFDATVTNTSGADESITLSQVGTSGQQGYVSALSDTHFGDITTTHGSATVDGSVLGTTCGIATNAFGAGSASNTTGAGTFPQSLAAGSGAPPSGGGSYSCQFDGVICGTPATITGVCAQGIHSPSSSVVAHLTGDDSPPENVSQTDNAFTANICLSVQ